MIPAPGFGKAGLGSVASMKLHRDLGVTQRTAWHLARRLRKSFEVRAGMFSDPVEVDETMAAIVGGRDRKQLRCRDLVADNGMAVSA